MKSLDNNIKIIATADKDYFGFIVFFSYNYTN